MNGATAVRGVVRRPGHGQPRATTVTILSVLVCKWNKSNQNWLVGRWRARSLFDWLFSYRCETLLAAGLTELFLTCIGPGIGRLEHRYKEMKRRKRHESLCVVHVHELNAKYKRLGRHAIFPYILFQFWFVFVFIFKSMRFAYVAASANVNDEARCFVAFISMSGTNKGMLAATRYTL